MMKRTFFQGPSTEKFVSSFIKENLMGVQFHPEKSHQYGINFLRIG